MGFEGLDPSDLDFYCSHNYDRFPERSVRAKRIQMIIEITDTLGFDKMELWMGECGHASWHPVGHGQCKEGGGNALSTLFAAVMAVIFYYIFI